MTRILGLALLLGVLSCFGTARVARATGDITQHRAVFRVVEIDAHGKQRVLASPVLVIGDGQSGLIEIGDERGKTVKAKLTTIPRTEPTQYTTEFTLLEGKTVLAAPKIVTLCDHEAVATIGGVDGSRTEFFVEVSEIAKPKYRRAKRSRRLR